MAKTIYRRKVSFKGFLFVFGLLLIASFLVYTQHQVNILQEKTREYIQFRIRVFQENINNSRDTEMGFLLTEVIQGTDYPIILTDTALVPQGCLNISPKIDSMRIYPPAVIDKLSKMAQQMDEENSPIPIKFQGITLALYHYGVSPVIQKLRWLPYIEVAAALLFVLIGYIGFSQIKKSEERYIWVGMAKETAHQLGTPLSSLTGWLEILKTDAKNSEKAISEIEVDTMRLTKVAARFSQIGSIPSFQQTGLIPVLDNIIHYFHRRIPQYEKKIEIIKNFKINPKVNINIDLFEWVLENLVKNAIDAIEEKKGKIVISLSHNIKKKEIYIDIIDTGKGINQRDRTDIFQPGFSSKKRGWGLGLSLARRIIEDYHHGKLLLKESKVGLGSTFRIVLKSIY